MEHGSRFVTGEFHNYRLVYAGLTHIGVEGMAQIMESETPALLGDGFGFLSVASPS